MRCCTKCDEVKLHTEFGTHVKAKDGFQSQCKKCSREAALAACVKARANYLLYITARGDACQICEQTFPQQVYNLHHMNPADKTSANGMNATKFTDRSLKDRIKEADKCALLCANCHIMEHVALRDGRTLLSHITTSATVSKEEL